VAGGVEACPRSYAILMPRGMVDAVEFLVDKLKNTKSNTEFFSAMNQ
jgi:transcription termination factor Rho